MELWVRRIALIAYVVGGWLLPAAHHHVATCDSTHPHVGVHDDCSHTHSPENVSECCSHSSSAGTVQHAPLPPGCPEELLVWETSLPSAAIASNHQHAHQCGDLCALCNARTLAESPIAVSVHRETVRCTANHRIESTTFEATADCWRPYTRGPPSLT